MMSGFIGLNISLPLIYDGTLKAMVAILPNGYIILLGNVSVKGKSP